jgi:hypothetical protein
LSVVLNGALLVEGFVKLPRMELRELENGTIEFRYVVEGGEYPGFDGRWRAMSESEQREHMYMGGKIGEWLRTLRQNRELR